MKKLTTILIAGTMTVQSVCGGMMPGIMNTVVYADDTAAQEEVLIDIDFEDGDTDGFTIFTEGGDCDIENKDGEIVVNIHKCGSKDYANQIYWDGFSLKKGAEYRFSFDVRSSIPRKIEYRMQLNGGDYHAYHGDLIDIGAEMQHVETTITMKEDNDPAPRLCFNMGRETDMTEDPGEHQIIFDNIQLIYTGGYTEIEEEVEIPLLISLNQTGYRPDDSKILVTEGELAGCEFSLKNVTGSTVYTGTLGDAFFDEATQREICQGDFSDFTQEGSYSILIGQDRSGRFKIKEDIYDELFKETLQMMYRQRCGMELNEELAGAYAHPACHTEEAVI